MAETHAALCRPLTLNGATASRLPAEVTARLDGTLQSSNISQATIFEDI